MLLLLAILIFLVVLGLSISGLYFFVEAPAARKRLRARVRAIEQSDRHPSTEFEAQIVRQELLSEIPILHRILSGIPGVGSLQLFLHQGAMKLTAGMLLLMALLLGLAAFVIALLGNVPILLAVAPAVCAGTGPFLLVAFMRYRRFSKFEESFADALDLLARAVRAGHAFTTGLELIGTEMTEPVAGEFRTTYEQQNLGLPLKDTLRNLAVHVPLPDVRVFITALEIQRESGGNVAEVLDKLCSVIRGRFQLHRQIRVYSAEGRMSLYLLTALPPVTGFCMYFANPEYLDPLFTDQLGHRMLGVAIALQIVGYFVIRKIIRMKV